MNKYSPTTIKKEAQLYLRGNTIPSIARMLGMPIQTVSWHLIHPLRDLDYRAWLCIRYKLLRRAINKDRADDEYTAIVQSGLIDSIEAQWEEVEKERRATK